MMTMMKRLGQIFKQDERHMLLLLSNIAGAGRTDGRTASVLGAEISAGFNWPRGAALALCISARR